MAYLHSCPDEDVKHILQNSRVMLENALEGKSNDVELSFHSTLKGFTSRVATKIWHKQLETSK